MVLRLWCPSNSSIAQPVTADLTQTVQNQIYLSSYGCSTGTWYNHGRLYSDLSRQAFEQLLKMAPTFRVSGAKSKVEEGQALTRFGRFFLGELWDTYIRHK